MINKRNKETILELAKNGKNRMEIYNLISSVTYNQVCHFLRKQKISMKHLTGTPRRYTLNEKFFDQIDNEEKAYWLGFMFGDGYVVGDGNIGLQLGIKDKDHIIKFQKCINSNHILYNLNRPRSITCRLHLYSTYMVKALAKYGIIQDKSHKTNDLPDINDNLFSHFVRGLIDADGNIYLDNRRNTNCGSVRLTSIKINILQTVKNWICTKINRNVGNIHNRIDKNYDCSCLSFSGNQIFKLIYDLIYKDCNIYLDRKYTKATQIYNGIIHKWSDSSS